ncbi:MAG: SPOR domain-containing protein [Flavobacteriia bacterium]|nr:SPOR domain-containing protein [Flavobacteriia bacterium]
MKIKLTILLLLLVNFSFSQTGNVEIIKDSRIDGLVKQQGAVIPPATVPQITGYRIQLFFDTDKKLVEDARSKFVTLFPKVETYIIYNAPNYFLKVGNFRTNLEAEKVKASVDKDFPTNFIVKELIFLPRID